MQPERKPLERPEPPHQPIEPEMPKGLDNDKSNTPDPEPRKDKRVDDL
jgi:hypothetical protein